MILFVGIRYSMRDLLSDLNKYACLWPDLQTICLCVRYSK